MAATPEKRVKDKCVELIKNFNAYHFFPPANGMGRAGIPDIIVCFKGKFLGIECKAGANKLTALQANEIEAIRRANGVAVVANEENWDMLPELIRKLKADTTIGDM